ncbi:MAG: peptidoglycan editing factor PgeF [Lachnospiraceae bacterium]|nr:peptidoglycan editing factor PgeF [Lachnospiraceae bacterium]
MNKYLEERINDKLPLIKYSQFDKVPFIEHGFTTRLGGVSSGIYKSLNLSFTRGDDSENVIKNYEIIAENIGCQISDFVASDQTHTTNIRIVTSEDKGKGITREKDYHDIDGLITNESGIVLFTYFADCVPLFFADEQKKVVAVSHSGWKGTAHRMGKVTVDTMCEEFGCSRENIICAIGPSICKSCYEVSEDLIEEFSKTYSENQIKSIFEEKENGKYLLDLWKANEIVLKDAGIKPEHIENREICTCCNKDVLFSHRGLNGKRGNLAAFIGMKPLQNMK